MSPAGIPTADLDDEASAGEAIRAGFSEYGLVHVRNHGVDAAELSRLYDAYSEICARPESEKQKLGGAEIWYQRGWTPPNTEQAVVATGQPDFKECYFAAPLPTDPDQKLQYPQIHADNVWPEGAPAFREAYLAVGRQLHEAGVRLLRAAARALGLEPGVFERGTEGGPHVLRLLRYLPLTSEQVGTPIVWGEEHTDFNLVTLLPGGRFHDPDGKPSQPPDSSSGLYLRTRGNEKVRGVAPPGCIVAQVGQALEILTGGTFLATPHVITAPSTPGYSRLSCAHFVHLHSHQMLFPLPEFRSDETILAYSPPVLAGTYGIKTLVDIHLAPQSALDRLGYRHYDRLATLRSHERANSSSGPIS